MRLIGKPLNKRELGGGGEDIFFKRAQHGNAFGTETIDKSKSLFLGKRIKHKETANIAVIYGGLDKAVLNANACKQCFIFVRIGYHAHYIGIAVHKIN